MLQYPRNRQLKGSKLSDQNGVPDVYRTGSKRYTHIPLAVTALGGAVPAASTLRGCSGVIGGVRIGGRVPTYWVSIQKDSQSGSKCCQVVNTPQQSWRSSQNTQLNPKMIPLSIYRTHCHVMMSGSSPSVIRSAATSMPKPNCLLVS